MRNAQRVRDPARIRHRLRSATFILGARHAILRPDLHGHADDVVALFPKQVPGHARVHAAAHPEEDALLIRGNHQGVKVDADADSVKLLHERPVRPESAARIACATRKRRSRRFAPLRSQKDCRAGKNATGSQATL